MDLAAAAAGDHDRVTRMSRPEQLADVGQSDLALRGLNDHASTRSGPTRQSDARDSELLVSVDVVRAWYCFDYLLLRLCQRPAVYRLGAERFGFSRKFSRSFLR